MSKEFAEDGLNRVKITDLDAVNLVANIMDRLKDHLTRCADGCFVSPHEVVGCMHGQLRKLSEAADASVRSGDFEEFQERCWKMLLPMAFAIIAVDKWSEE